MLSDSGFKVREPKLAKESNTADSKSQLRQILETEDVKSINDISLEDYQKIFHELLVHQSL